jgi:hypothetical protein
MSGFKSWNKLTEMLYRVELLLGLAYGCRIEDCW